MPSDYRCDRCPYSVTLGWYHFHVFDSGYGAATNMWCTACGAQHELRIAITPAFRQTLLDAARLHDVVLDRVGRRPKKVLAALIKEERLTRAEAETIMAAAPTVIGGKHAGSSAKHLQEALEAFGARVSLRDAGMGDTSHIAEQHQDALWVMDQGHQELDTSKMTEDELQALLEHEHDGWSPCTVDVREDGPTGTIVLACQRCGRCGAKGTLASALPAGRVRCPRCGEGFLRGAGSWVT